MLGSSFKTVSNLDLKKCSFETSSIENFSFRLNFNVNKKNIFWSQQFTEQTLKKKLVFNKF